MPNFLFHPSACKLKIYKKKFKKKNHSFHCLQFLFVIFMSTIQQCNHRHLPEGIVWNMNWVIIGLSGGKTSTNNQLFTQSINCGKMLPKKESKFLAFQRFFRNTGMFIISLNKMCLFSLQLTYTDCKGKSYCEFFSGIILETFPNWI